MEMGKLTAKLRDAVPICLVVDNKEVKRYKNIEIPDELKKLEYQDFKFDVPLNGAITFKVMFEPGVLPEEFPQMRERKTRKLFGKEVQTQKVASAVDVMVEAKLQPQDEQVTEALGISVAGVTAQAREDAQTVAKTIADIAAAIADGEAIMAEVEDDGEEKLSTHTIGTMETATIVQPENIFLTNKQKHQGKGKKGITATDSVDN